MTITHHPPFLQIAAGPDGEGARLYGLDAEGRTWALSNEGSGWWPLPTKSVPFDPAALPPLGPGLSADSIAAHTGHA